MLSTVQFKYVHNIVSSFISIIHVASWILPVTHPSILPSNECTSSIYILYFYKDDSSTRNNQPAKTRSCRNWKPTPQQKTDQSTVTNQVRLIYRKGRKNKPQTTNTRKTAVKHYSKFYYGRIENHHPTNKELEWKPHTLHCIKLNKLQKTPKFFQ